MAPLINQNNEEVEANPKTTVNAKVVKAIKKLQALYNNDANKMSRKQLKKEM